MPLGPLGSNHIIGIHLPFTGLDVDDQHLALVLCRINGGTYLLLVERAPALHSGPRLRYCCNAMLKQREKIPDRLMTASL